MIKRFYLNRKISNISWHGAQNYSTNQRCLFRFFQHKLKYFWKHPKHEQELILPSVKWNSRQRWYTVSQLKSAIFTSLHVHQTHTPINCDKSEKLFLQWNETYPHDQLIPCWGLYCRQLLVSNSPCNVIKQCLPKGGYLCADTLNLCRKQFAVIVFQYCCYLYNTFNPDIKKLLIYYAAI